MKSKAANSINFDIGSSKIAIISAHLNYQGNIQVLNQNLCYSDGINGGIISDFAKAEQSIGNAIYTLEKQGDYNISKVNINVSGIQTKSYYTHYKTKISREIEKQDVHKIIDKILSNFHIKDQSIIHYYPIEFIVNDQDGIQNPIGMKGSEFGCRMHIITANTSMLNNLVNCFAKFHIQVDQIILTSIASCFSCLSENESKLGSILIDFGDKNTSFCIFLDNKPLYIGNIPLGGWHISCDLAKVLSLGFSAAEKLKILHGYISNTGNDRGEIINLDQLEEISEEDSNSRQVVSSLVADIIKARAEEIIFMLKNKYDQLNIDHLITNQIIITGGGAMIRGIKELLAQIFLKQVRIATPIVLPGFVEDYNPHSYSAAIGSLMYQKLQQEKQTLTQQNNKINWINKVIKWIKENI